MAIIFWLLPLGTALHYFCKNSKTSAAYSPPCAFIFFGLVLVGVQSGSNLNNLISLSFVLMAVFSLRTLAIFHAGHALSLASFQGVIS